MSNMKDPGISQMMDLIQLMNSGLNDHSDNIDTPKRQSPLNDYLSEKNINLSEDEKGRLAMKSILEAFNGAQMGEIVEGLVEKSKTNPVLKEALETVDTDDGVKIGDWKIQINNEETQTTYDIFSSDGKKVIESINLYDVAHSIVTHMNEGKFINDKKILNLLQEDENYDRARTTAAYYNRLLKESTDSAKIAIYEERFRNAFAKVKDIRKKVRKG